MKQLFPVLLLMLPATLFCQKKDAGHLPSVIVKEYTIPAKKDTAELIIKRSSIWDTIETSWYNDTATWWIERHPAYSRYGRDQYRRSLFFNDSTGGANLKPKWFDWTGTEWVQQPTKKDTAQLYHDYTSSITFTVTAVGVGAYHDENGSLCIPPAPGYRETSYYCAGRWWSEDEYFSRKTKYYALCSLHYFADNDSKYVWINKFEEMSNARFARLQDLLDTDSVINAGGYPRENDSIHILFKGDDGHYHYTVDFDLEQVKQKLLAYIKKSRYPAKK